MTVTYDYLRDGPEIYAQSFAVIRAGADLSRIPPALEPVAVRMIHACGMLDLPADLDWSPGFAEAAAAALRAGAAVIADSEMVAHGVTRRRLPADNPVVCTLHDPGLPELAAALGTTRSAAAIDRWVPHLDGAVVAIGNAPTALFRLLELLADPTFPRPAAIIGVPVGFVGSAESKVALAESALGVPWLTVHGTRGGSAMAGAAVNALASGSER